LLQRLREEIDTASGQQAGHERQSQDRQTQENAGQENWAEQDAAEDSTQPIPAISQLAVSYLPGPVAREVRTPPDDATAPAAAGRPASAADHRPASPAVTGRATTPTASGLAGSPPAANGHATPPNGRSATPPPTSQLSADAPAAREAPVGRPAPAMQPDRQTVRPGAPAGRRYRLIGAAAVLVLIAVASVTFLIFLPLFQGTSTPPDAPPGVTAAELSAAAAARGLAAAWVAAQVSPQAVVSCDPVMCRALQLAHFPGGQLQVLGPAAAYPSNSDVVVATPTIRNQYGSSLASAYAPAVLAAFGSGNTRIEIRAVAPQGAAAYNAALNADVLARKANAATLLGSSRLVVPPGARKQLTAGQVDSRLLIAIAGIASLRPVTIADFGDSGPAASPGIPFRSVDLAMTSGAPPTLDSAYVRSVQALLSGLPDPYHPAQLALVPLPGGETVLRIEYAAPVPLGLLGPQSP